MHFNYTASHGIFVVALLSLNVLSAFLKKHIADFMGSPFSYVVAMCYSIGGSFLVDERTMSPTQ